MRDLGRIDHPECRVSLFSWNNRYIVKFEQGLCEQTLKFEHLELGGETELRQRLSPEFISKVAAHFPHLHALRETFFE